tara:strand:- start:26 stop:202 length:177 start_codon:yes stop_codon:yes gene_type:complete
MTKIKLNVNFTKDELLIIVIACLEKHKRTKVRGFDIYPKEENNLINVIKKINQQVGEW